MNPASKNPKRMKNEFSMSIKEKNWKKFAIKLMNSPF